MPCQKDGKKGFKWGESGICFTGPDARKRAAAVAAAVEAKGVAKAEEIQAIELEVALMDETAIAQIVRYLGLIKVADDPAGKLLPEQGTEFVRKGEPRHTQIKKTDDELQIVWGEVYVPNIPDSHRHYMTEMEVMKMAYRTLADALTGRAMFEGYDTQHDNIACQDVIVESFIARPGDPDFLPGAWVVGLHISDPDRWHLVKTGELNGFSMQASVLMEECEVEIDLPESVTGETAVSSDGDLHPHRFKVRFSETGEYLGGETTEGVRADGLDRHGHRIVRGSLTEPAGNPPHTHRFSLIDMMFPNGTIDDPPVAP